MGKTILIFFLLLPLSLMGAKKEKQINYLNLGGLLVKDGYYSRANETLKKVDIEVENFDFAQFYTLKGIIYQNLGYPLISNIYLEEAIKKGQTSQSLYLYMARNYWNLEDYDNVIDAIKKAGDEAKKQQSFFVILAESYKRKNNFNKAWETLDEGITYFPKHSKFYRQKFYYLMELGFYKKALKYAKEYLKYQNYTTKDYLAVSLVLRENKLYNEAAALLEEAVLKTKIDNPEYKKLVELLGQVYIDNENYISAALVLDKASITNPKFAHKAATLYLKSKLPIRSLQLNRRVIDQKDKFQQRVGIDIFLEDFESLVATKPALKRYALLKDEKLRYALGYAYFMVGDFKLAKTELKQITNQSLFQKATYIFNKIDKCESNPLECDR